MGALMSGRAVLENVRDTAPTLLRRQTARSVLLKNGRLLEQAYEWERRAMSELEAYFSIRDGRSQWEIAAVA
jgi:hypothetical protein